MKRRLTPIRALVLVVFALSAQGIAWAENRIISPEETDPAIDGWLEDHYVCFDAAAPRQGRLFVFMPGTGGTPNRYTILCGEAATAGLHAINLSYPNDRAVEWHICKESEDPDCTEKVRLEQFDGKDRTTGIDVNRANCIENRLIRLLAHLDGKYPKEGWGRYLTEDGEPEWESIVISGHSQGGGHAAMIGTHRRVARVAMFAWTDFHKGKLATWITPDTKTPIDRFYGFRHLEDRIEATREVWLKLGLDRFGPEVDVSTADPPYSNTHMLVSSLDTDLAKTQDGPPWLGHLIIITDPHTPEDSDHRPLFAPAWRYMMGIVE
jgi:hypothetical protein